MTVAADEPYEQNTDLRDERVVGQDVGHEGLAYQNGMTKSARKRYYLVKYQDLPLHLQGNEFILDHYRSEWPLRETVLSLFTIHNETLNIWTHLVGFLIFLGLAVYTITAFPNLILWSELPDSAQYENSFLGKAGEAGLLPRPGGPITRWPFLVFLAGAMCCLIFSSTYHLFSCHTLQVHNILHRLDHAGIAVLIATSYFPPIYYAFLCHHRLQTIYLTGITVIGLTTILFASLPFFRSHEFRKYRALLFSCTATFGAIPAIHKLAIYWHEPLAIKGFEYEIAMSILYGVGALLYAARVPERYRPGCFDIVGHSHQIFHVLVVLAALAHYKAGLADLQWRDSHGCP